MACMEDVKLFDSVGLKLLGDKVKAEQMDGGLSINHEGGFI